MIWSALFLALSGMALFMLWRDVQKGATSILGFTKSVEQARSPGHFWLAVAVQLLLFSYVFVTSLFELLVPAGLAPAPQ
jgi:hypothetical protein